MFYINIKVWTLSRGIRDSRTKNGVGCGGAPRKAGSYRAWFIGLSTSAAITTVVSSSLRFLYVAFFEALVHLSGLSRELINSAITTRTQVLKPTRTGTLLTMCCLAVSCIREESDTAKIHVLSSAALTPASPFSLALFWRTPWISTSASRNAEASGTSFYIKTRRDVTFDFRRTGSSLV